MKIIDFQSRRNEWNPALAERVAQMYEEAVRDQDRARALLCMSALDKSPSAHRRDARAAAIEALRETMQARAGFR